MDNPTKEQIEKLPKWAQEYISDLQRQRNTAINSINTMVDNQTKSSIYYDEYLCLSKGSPDKKRFYIHTENLVVEHNGVLLRLGLYPSAGHPGIHIQTESINGNKNDVAIVPMSHNKIKIVSTDGML